MLLFEATARATFLSPVEEYRNSPSLSIHTILVSRSRTQSVPGRSTGCIADRSAELNSLCSASFNNNELSPFFTSREASPSAGALHLYNMTSGFLATSAKNRFPAPKKRSNSSDLSHHVVRNMQLKAHRYHLQAYDRAFLLSHLCSCTKSQTILYSFFEAAAITLTIFDELDSSLNKLSLHRPPGR